MTKGKTKIADNPSVQSLKSILPLVRGINAATGLLRSVGLRGGKVEKIHDSTTDILSKAEVLDIPDQFNSAFSEDGWIATNSMSIDIMRKALTHHAGDDYEAAEAEILSWFSENTIDLFAVKRSKSFNKASERWMQLREALALTKEERYLAAVPFILIACDGFASDVLGKSPFEKDADLTLFDSLVGHPTSLPTLIQKLIKGVRKSSDVELTLPLRHGILHGRSLGYGNHLVCCKAWMLMIALVDWAVDKRDEEDRKQKLADQKNTSWADISHRHRKLNNDKKVIDAFQPIKWTLPLEEVMEMESPVLAFEQFLESWKTKNFGTMAKRSVNMTQMKNGHLAGRLRGDAELIQLTEYKVHSVWQPTVARAEARVFLRGKNLENVVQGEFEILGFRHTPTGDVAMPTDEGSWTVQQGCMFDLLHERTIEVKNLERNK